MAADVADGATHPSSPTIRKKYVAIMMMIVVINMRIIIMIMIKIIMIVKRMESLTPRPRQ